MQLESVEEKALNYLGQVSNPLVRIDVLYAHLMDADSSEGILLSDLEVFLTHHELFRVIKPLPQEAGGGMDELASSDGGASISYVILDTRVPTEQQNSAMMLDQLNSMHEALSVAHAEAQDTADYQRLSAMDDALARIDALRQKVTDSINPSGRS